MPQFGSDPQLIGINSNLRSAVERLDKLDGTISSLRRSLDSVTQKLDRQTALLYRLLGEEPPPDEDDTSY